MGGNPNSEIAADPLNESDAALNSSTVVRDHPSRFMGLRTIPLQAPDLAIRELERCVKELGLVGVQIGSNVGDWNLDHERLFPVFEAAARHGLPVGIHINRTPGMALLSPVGFVSYYFEFHPQYTMYYYPHVASLVMAGIFAKIPELRFVLVEGGVSWLTPFMWRLDHYWQEFGSEVPWLDKPPSEYVRKHVLVTTQPLERPSEPRRLNEYLGWMGSRQMVMFSTDYPHWDYDHPEPTLRRLPSEVRELFAYENAAGLYGFSEFGGPATPPPSALVG